jgi:hypothetical protein
MRPSRSRLIVIPTAARAARGWTGHHEPACDAVALGHLIDDVKREVVAQRPRSRSRALDPFQPVVPETANVVGEAVGGGLAHGRARAGPGFSPASPTSTRSRMRASMPWSPASCSARSPTRTAHWPSYTAPCAPAASCVYEHVIRNCQPKRLLLQAADHSGPWPRIAGGCHPARDTGAAIERAGFEIQTSERLMFAAASLEPAIPFILGHRTARVIETLGRGLDIADWVADHRCHGDRPTATRARRAARGR